MAINDPVGDMLARIRNAQMRGHKVAMTPASKVRGWVLDVLEREGYIRGYTRVEEAGNKAHFEIELKYFDGEPVIQHIKRACPSRAAAFIPRSTTWRRCATVLAFPSCRRPRASCPTPPPVKPMSAEKSSPRSTKIRV